MAWPCISKSTSPTAVSRSGGPALQEQVHLAEYSHLPVGSMHGDWALQTLDALFGRRLRDGGHLLWLADPALPDIAGSADPTAVDDRFFAEEAGTEVREIGHCAGMFYLGAGLGKLWRCRLGEALGSHAAVLYKVVLSKGCLQQTSCHQGSTSLASPRECNLRCQVVGSLAVSASLQKHDMVCCAVQVVFPGAYRCVCVQLKIHHLAVNAVCQVSNVPAQNLDSLVRPRAATLWSPDGICLLGSCPELSAAYAWIWA